MITQKEQAKLRDFLPRNYITKVMDLVEKEKEKKTPKSFYTKTDVSLTLSGERDFPVIEKFIYDVAFENKKLIEARDQSKNQFLSTQSK